MQQDGLTAGPSPSACDGRSQPGNVAAAAERLSHGKRRSSIRAPALTSGG